MSGPFRYIHVLKNFTYLANPRYLSGLMYETCNITNIYAEDIMFFIKTCQIALYL
jgi:hypothetical protein